MSVGSGDGDIMYVKRNWKEELTKGKNWAKAEKL